MCMKMFEATAMDNILGCLHVVLFQTQLDMMRPIKGVSNTATTWIHVANLGSYKLVCDSTRGQLCRNHKQFSLMLRCANASTCTWVSCTRPEIASIMLKQQHQFVKHADVTTHKAPHCVLSSCATW